MTSRIFALFECSHSLQNYNIFEISMKMNVLLSDSDDFRFIDVSKHFHRVVIKLLWIVTRIRDDNPPFFLSSLEILK